MGIGIIALFRKCPEVVAYSFFIVVVVANNEATCSNAAWLRAHINVPLLCILPDVPLRNTRSCFRVGRPGREFLGEPFVHGPPFETGR